MVTLWFRRRELIAALVIGETCSAPRARTHLPHPCQSSRGKPPTQPAPKLQPAATAISTPRPERAAQHFNLLTRMRQMVMLHWLAGELQALQDPAACPHIHTSIQHRNNPDLVRRTRSSRKESPPALWGRGKTPFFPSSPPYTLQKHLLALSALHPACSPPGKRTPSRNKTTARRELPHFLQARALTPAGLCISCSDRACFLQTEPQPCSMSSAPR